MQREETGITHLKKALRYSASTGTKLTPLTCTKVTAMKDQATAKVEMAKVEKANRITQKDRVDIMHGVWTATARNVEIKSHTLNTTSIFMTQLQTMRYRAVP